MTIIIFNFISIKIKLKNKKCKYKIYVKFRMTELRTLILIIFIIYSFMGLCLFFLRTIYIFTKKQLIVYNYNVWHNTLCIDITPEKFIHEKKLCYLKVFKIKFNLSIFFFIINICIELHIFPLPDSNVYIKFKIKQNTECIDLNNLPGTCSFYTNQKIRYIFIFYYILLLSFCFKY